MVTNAEGFRPGHNTDSRWSGPVACAVVGLESIGRRLAKTGPRSTLSFLENIFTLSLDIVS